MRSAADHDEHRGRARRGGHGQPARVARDRGRLHRGGGVGEAGSAAARQRANPGALGPAGRPGGRRAGAGALLAERGGPVPGPGSRWGVWAAQPPGSGLTAARAARGWRLTGLQQYCSGARVCTGALVTAAAPDGARLFAVATGGLAPVPGSWPATGMAGSDTLDVGFDDVAAEPVGPVGGYTGRPGFAHGGVGVAACWYGGGPGAEGAPPDARPPPGAAA